MAEPKIWANLIHLSYNMWSERGSGSWSENTKHLRAERFLRFDEKLWDDLLQQMASAGFSMVVIDVGDGIQFDSHPRNQRRRRMVARKTQNRNRQNARAGLGADSQTEFFHHARRLAVGVLPHGFPRPSIMKSAPI